MPRKQAARNARDTSESEDPADILASAQQKMATVGFTQAEHRYAC